MIDIKDTIFDFDQLSWNACVPENHPFLKFEFYQALEESKCLGAKVGWIPYYLSYSVDGIIKAILPIYLKSHSYGEFIFDWSWAQAYERYGLSYYPKITAALPHTPVSAPKVITKDNITIDIFLDAIKQISKDHRCSSTHLLFTSKDETAILQTQKEYLQRASLQYHFENNNYKHFDDYLLDLRKNKRKNFKKERETIAASSIVIKKKTGQEITLQDAKFMSKVYLSTIEKKWSQAYLNPLFFERWFELQHDQMLYLEASLDDSPVAAAIHLFSHRTLFGRYWGCLQEIPYLHFELCYYLAIEYAIEHQLKTVEAGAQGEQKLLRGFKPVVIDSFHLIENPSFKTAIQSFLKQESEQIHQYKTQVEKQLLPFKRANDQ